MNMMKNTFLSLALLALSASADVPTYCNPMSLPVTTVFTCDFSVVVRAYRLIWRDCGLKGRMGLDVGGYRYRIEYRDGETWKTLVDASRSSDDLFVDYRETPAVRTRELRLTVLGAPEGATPGVTEFTVFGE